ncbi:hypothetical protein VTK26DRAFT_5753 [Humicola hyalothermophila]
MRVSRLRARNPEEQETPHIANVVELLLDKEQPPWLIMECAQDDLDTVLMGLALTHRLVVLSRLIQAAAHIHTRDFVYLDIKPSNILVQCDGNEPVVKLADVDTTKTTKTLPTMTTFVGTPVYMAPEIWRHERPSGKPTDMWTVGLVALTGNKINHGFMESTVSCTTCWDTTFVFPNGGR